MSRARIARGFIAAVLVTVLTFALPAGIVWGTDQELREARQELRETKAKIRAREQKMRALQRDLNRLATSIAMNEAQINEATARMDVLLGKLHLLEARTLRLQARLDQRNREAYIQGPGAPVLYLLTATSAAEAAARLSFLSEMNHRDEVLARKVGENAERLSRGRAELARLQRARDLALQQLEVDRAELRVRMAEMRRLSALLRVRKEEILDTISRIRPFAVCPVGHPHAISDSFGIWVHRSKERGGDHVHQGDDIMAPMGTPIYAPFDGVAVAAPNKMGGLAVKVFGEYGYVYNAHGSGYGKLGAVETGDVVGYVGATGNTSAPHNHFEWHPGNGAAVDPYPFLLMVC
jgi:murein DD-endopeptidase MepM/ murein hydrolase activator NlpD